MQYPGPAVHAGPALLRSLAYRAMQSHQLPFTPCAPAAFNHILGDVSLVVYQFESLAGFSAVIDRLGEFSEVLTGSR